MSIDERLRAGLPAAVDDVAPHVEADLAALLRRATRRSRMRRAASAVGLLAAGAVAAVTLGLGRDDSQRSVDPVGPGTEVPVLDSERGSAAVPAPLQEGRYAIPVIGAVGEGLVAEVDVPARWGQDRLALATGPDLEPHVRRVEVFVVDWVAPDPCGSAMNPVAQGVPAVVAALSSHRSVEPSAARPTSIGGYDGRLLQFRVPARVDVDRCWAGQGDLRPMGVGAGWTSVFPGWTYRTWVLDVDGSPLVILAAHGPSTTAGELAELTDLVRGMRITAPR